MILQNLTFYLISSLSACKIPCQGAFINHVDMAGGGGLPNVHITTLALLSKRGVKNVQKSVHMVYE